MWLILILVGCALCVPILGLSMLLPFFPKRKWLGVVLTLPFGLAGIYIASTTHILLFNAIYFFVGLIFSFYNFKKIHLSRVWSIIFLSLCFSTLVLFILFCLMKIGTDPPFMAGKPSSATSYIASEKAKIADGQYKSAYILPENYFFGEYFYNKQLWAGGEVIFEKFGVLLFWDPFFEYLYITEDSGLQMSTDYDDRVASEINLIKAEGYTPLLIANIDSDQELDVWITDESKRVNHLKNDLKNGYDKLANCSLGVEYRNNFLIINLSQWVINILIFDFIVGVILIFISSKITESSK